MTAAIFAHLPGQDSERSLVEIIYGNQSPSGRLPCTVAKKTSGYGTLQSPTAPDANSGYCTQSNFTEILLIDYRHFLAGAITPRFPFGYGLTYTTFNYGSLVTGQLYNATNLTPAPALATAPLAPGGNPALFETVATVNFTLTNAGSVAAAEVAQLYIRFLVGNTGVRPLVQPRPPAIKWLRGYSKDMLAPAQSTQVQYDLTRRDLSRWNTTAQDWYLQSGTYGGFVGGNVLADRFSGSLKILT